jgi:hypothetical protein
MHSTLIRLIRLRPVAALPVAPAVVAQAAKNYSDKPLRVIVGCSPKVSGAKAD